MLDTKEQSVRANNYSLSTWKCLPEEIYSIEQKGHKTKPEKANGYCFDDDNFHSALSANQSSAFLLCFWRVKQISYSISDTSSSQNRASWTRGRCSSRCSCQREEKKSGQKEQTERKCCCSWSSHGFPSSRDFPGLCRSTDHLQGWMEETTKYLSQFAEEKYGTGMNEIWKWSNHNKFN